MRAIPKVDREYAESVEGALDRFEIVRTLSQGGMADLFLARERTCVGVDRLVVLKRLRLKYLHDPDCEAIFLDECRLALRLEHPRIVRAYGAVEWEGGACLALEYLQGIDAGTLLAGGVSGASLGLEAATTIVHAIADALAYAHRLADQSGEPLRVVHRDVSPANVFVCRDGSVKLIDFGVASTSRSQRPAPKGVLKGKFQYMSPEQCRDQLLDGRSDLFSLGIVLYELVTGRRPFRAPRSVEVVRQILEQPVEPPSRRDASFPADLERLLLRMLDKDRDRRPATAGDVRDELVAIGRRLGFAMSRFELTGLIDLLSASEPVPRREPSDTTPNPTRLEEPVVLVVDDEESFHAITTKRLQSYRRISAYTALQALDALAAHTVDVVLLDLNLPDRNGLEILEQLRSLRGDAAVIVCSAEADVDLAVECMKRGAFDYLVKCHESFAVLGSRVKSALRRRGTPPRGVAL